ncbi:MAG: hypothetical protein IJH98_02125, partial [Solobacterium sp.]|nr:hypothetical protein [Solobacterium sp.]
MKTETQVQKERFNRFSVPLGLLDYVNPVLYSITMITIIRSLYPVMNPPYSRILLAGAVISIFFGLIIPTGKVLVGLGIIRFRMPVSLVFCVNTGILLSGLMMITTVLNLQPAVLILLAAVILAALAGIYSRSREINTIAVLTGAAGYLLLYFSLITPSLQKHTALPVVLYALAIVLFVMLCDIGIKADLKNPKVHWVIEISNVLCQFFVAAAT